MANQSINQIHLYHKERKKEESIPCERKMFKEFVNKMLCRKAVAVYRQDLQLLQT
jgi:hypothetical protein